jgi:hypothetical protein
MGPERKAARRQKKTTAIGQSNSGRHFLCRGYAVVRRGQLFHVGGVPVVLEVLGRLHVGGVPVVLEIFHVGNVPIALEVV